MVTSSDKAFSRKKKNKVTIQHLAKRKLNLIARSEIQMGTGNEFLN